MAVLRALLTLATLGAHAHGAVLSVRSDDVTLSLEPQLTGGFQMILLNGEEQVFAAHIGRTLVSTSYSSAEVEGGVRLQLPAAALTLRTVADAGAGARGVHIDWDADTHTRLEDCFQFGEKHWYAGPMQVKQEYPIENAEQVYAPYVSKEKDNGAIVERYWLNSAGEYIYVHPEVPLFVDYNNILNNNLCFGAQIAAPYSTRRNHTGLSYDIWFHSDVKKAHQHAVATYLGKPLGVPDYEMVKHPIWSTWAQYERHIDEANVIKFAEEIIAHEFPYSQLEIDDLWEVCYGSLTVDPVKFPDFAGLVSKLKAMGFRVTIWVHPFINQGCEPWYSEALNNGYLVLDETGSAETSWWNGNGSAAGYVDFTNPAAADWWHGRVNTLIQLYGIDSLKFDAGESSFSPQIPVQTGDIDLHPHHIVSEYVKTCARFGNMIEVRAGFRTQELPIFVRMVDRDSIWGLNNGLSTVVTTALQMNLNGYTLVLPDMIGGNGFNLDHDQADLPTKELYIRWVQATTFLPAMQFSFVPWLFDDETVEISLKYTQLHATYADRIYAAMNASAAEGAPVTAPLWWLDPRDQEALAIGDQYLLGSDVLVAPVLVAGAVSRDVYLPAGSWRDGHSGAAHAGPGWLRDYPAPLDMLPYFVRQPEAGSAAAPAQAALLLAAGLVVAFINGF